MKAIKTKILAALMLLVSSSAWAQSHAIINMSRSSMTKNMFILQALDGEYGQYRDDSDAVGNVEGFLRVRR